MAISLRVSFGAVKLYMVRTNPMPYFVVRVYGVTVLVTQSLSKAYGRFLSFARQTNIDRAALIAFEAKGVEERAIIAALEEHLREQRQNREDELIEMLFP